MCSLLLLYPVLQKTYDLHTQEISLMLCMLFCPFSVLYMMIYKDNIPYLIWVRPDMEPSIWQLGKYFQCSSHNEHWEFSEDQSPPLCHGICKRKGCSQVGVRTFVLTIFEKGVGDRQLPAKTSCLAIALIPPALGSGCSPGGLISSWSREGVILRSSLQCLAIGYSSVSDFNVLVLATNC
jgi:hypothetical protein